MYIQSLTQTEESIPRLIEQTTSTVVSKDIQVIECSDLEQSAPNVIILKPDEFFNVLEMLQPKYIFLYRGLFDAWEMVQAEFSNDPEKRMKSEIYTKSSLNLNVISSKEPSRRVATCSTLKFSFLQKGMCFHAGIFLRHISPWLMNYIAFAKRSMKQLNQ